MVNNIIGDIGITMGLGALGMAAIVGIAILYFKWRNRK